MSDGRVGALVHSLAEGVRAELGEIAEAFEALRLRVDTLGEAARAINGLGGACTGWSNHLTSLLTEVRKEQTEVPAKLMGTPINPIVSTVNEEHAEKVRQQRRAS